MGRGAARFRPGTRDFRQEWERLKQGSSSSGERGNVRKLVAQFSGQHAMTPTELAAHLETLKSRLTPLTQWVKDEFRTTTSVIGFTVAAGRFLTACTKQLRNPTVVHKNQGYRPETGADGPELLIDSHMYRLLGICQALEAEMQVIQAMLAQAEDLKRAYMAYPRVGPQSPFGWIPTEVDSADDDFRLECSRITSTA